MIAVANAPPPVRAPPAAWGAGERDGRPGVTPLAWFVGRRSITRRRIRRLRRVTRRTPWEISELILSKST